MRLARRIAVPLALSGVTLLPSLVLAQKGEAGNGPFGLRMGMSASELRQVLDVKVTEPDQRPLVLQTDRLPKHHDAFEGYLLIVSDKVGLCKIVGLGETISVKPEGKELKSAFEDLERAIERKYGKHLTRDELEANSNLGDKKQWMQALHGKERALAAFWDAEERSTLSDDIFSIVLDARALSESEGYLRLSYAFNNWDRCEAEGKQARRQASADAL
ncbi:MAG TPA: hypothetical protein VFM14_01780 [Gemmatimonadales bacterium]|nr:hypothetical protein [Gemmatimonadales bacterium]